jgi:hypothetical protein
MKTKATLKKHFIKAALTISLLLPLITIAQPDYIFTNPVHLSGTDLQIGASYRFPDVKPGIDGIITITDITGGMSLSELDGASGFDEAFQPYINCAGKQKGYVEFQLDFVLGGTFIPAMMTEVPLTAIDIDGWRFGDGDLYEFDQFEKSPSFTEQYDLIGGSLNIADLGSWTEAQNKTAITYDGIDTIQRDVMYSAIHDNVFSVKFRVGGDNRSASSMTRLRSVYFKKFTYTTLLLPINGLLSFNGLVQQNTVQLNWELNANSLYQKITVEKSNSGKGFVHVAEFAVSNSGINQKMTYRDPVNIQGNTFYRLKTTDQQGKVFYSQVIVMKFNAQAVSGFRVYPNIISSGASVNLTASHKDQASLMITDFNGRVLKQQQFQVQSGTNSIAISGMEAWATGQYVVVLQVGGEKYAQQIMKR